MLSTKLLNSYDNKINKDDLRAELQDNALIILSTFRECGIDARITGISCGPTVTRYDFHPKNLKDVDKFSKLTNALRFSLASEGVRVLAPVPGKAAIGVEVPNKNKQTVGLRDLLDNDSFTNHKSDIAFAVGKNLSGGVVVADLAKMPHLLIAGATGSGKSVFLNTLILSIVYKSTPDKAKFIMIDPKRVELVPYASLPHLLLPVVTDPQKASETIDFAVALMESRYKDFQSSGVRNIAEYNDKMDKKMERIVIIIDELADLMMVARHSVENAIVRLSQLARAAGIHLVVATQRPTVKVITGLIKANMPSRVAFATASIRDSVTIIDTKGADELLGQGDMLFSPSDQLKPTRLQGAYVSEAEIEMVVSAARLSYGLQVSR